jgi:hypothetical protein
MEAAGRGWMPRKTKLPVKGKVFLLDIPFYRTLYNLVGVVKRHVECLSSAFRCVGAELVFFFTY